MKNKISVWSCLPEELKSKIVALGEKKYRADQILNWLYNNKITDISEWKNIPGSSKEIFNNRFSTLLPSISDIQISKDGTRKYLLQLVDGELIEMVLIPADEKLTLCISSQVGCKRGCRFCATAKLGFRRNLKVEEIVGQVFIADLESDNKKLTNIVFMGMGEPLDNLDNVIKAVKILQSEQCFSFSPRRITISTCGIVPEIIKLAEGNLKIKLAVSLNAAIDKKRSQIMPVNREYPLAELKNALQTFSKSNRFRITFEYVMIHEFNMFMEDVTALRKFCGDISSKINLIAWNNIPELNWQQPDQNEINSFLSILYKNCSCAITLRNSRGSDISAACGMLAGKRKNK